MGVPAITLVGDRIPSRLAYSFYKQLAIVAPHVPWLELFVATTWDEYVAKSVALAKEPRPLIDIRRKLRGYMESTEMLNHARYTETWESILGEMWRRYLATSTG
jgi:predicted O-linked N-acetylglucosamine transferase (SPINDLY family)